MSWQHLQQARPTDPETFRRLHPHGAAMLRNDEYVVIVEPPSIDTPMPDGWLHLSIRRDDREPIHDWRDLQQIKNDVAGDEAEAIEIYPAESRLVDGANQYHLWVLPKGVKVGVGFTKRSVCYDADEGKRLSREQFGIDTTNARQRAREEPS